MTEILFTQRVATMSSRISSPILLNDWNATRSEWSNSDLKNAHWRKQSR